jgi:hypothetical protein
VLDAVEQIEYSADDTDSDDGGDAR